VQFWLNSQMVTPAPKVTCVKTHKSDSYSPTFSIEIEEPEVSAKEQT